MTVKLTKACAACKPEAATETTLRKWRPSKDGTQLEDENSMQAGEHEVIRTAICRITSNLENTYKWYYLFGKQPPGLNASTHAILHTWPAFQTLAIIGIIYFQNEVIRSRDILYQTKSTPTLPINGIHTVTARVTYQRSCTCAVNSDDASRR